MAGESSDGRSLLDDVARDLQALRMAAGSPSYAVIVQRIAGRRRERGISDRPARTTVYDAFRTGRRRLDVSLVLDIVEALGGSEEERAEWEDRCRAALSPGIPAVAAAEQPPPAAPEPSWPTADARGLRFRVVLLAVCLVVNLVGRTLVDFLHLPLYLDMIGTAVAAVVLGPWWGALVGVSTNLAGVGISGTASVPFALVNVVGALLWGYGVRRWGLGRSVPRFMLLNVVVAVGCTLTAVPIVVLVFDGLTPNAADDVTVTMLSLGTSLVLSVFSSNLLTSLVDKMIAGFIALVAVELLVGVPSRPSRLAGPPGRA